ncbi:MAG: SLC13 family permease, partial [Candidatus Brocadiaceae bacterium]|nr:SLC13 family permease [Candidatus Brocadiaceae bacterium]
LFFFMGLFIIVGGVIKVGLISNLSESMISLTKPSAENMFVTAITTLWFSAISSAIVDNIPFVASMIPLVIDTAHAVLPSGTDFKSVVQHSTLMPVWWSLALGACLGGNGTPVGASANVITLGLAEKAGYPISFKRFIAYGIPITIETIFISNIYIWLRYYILS